MEGRLDGVAAVVVVDDGVDEGPVDGLTRLLETAGADVRGRLRLQSGWALGDLEDRERAAEALELSARSAEQLRQRMARLVVADLGSAVAISGDDTGAADALEAVDLIEFEANEDALVADDDAEILFVFVTGPDSSLGSAAHIVSLADAAVDLGAATIVAEVQPVDAVPERRADGRGAWIAPVYEADVGDRLTTVDHLDVLEGPLATVLAAIGTVDGEVGRYGYGEDATSPVPVVEPR